MKKEITLTDVDVNMKASKNDDNTIIYFNPKEDSRFLVEGLAWFNKEHEYFRLPINCKDKVTEAVYWLSSHPSGGQIRFKTNAKTIRVKIKNKGDYQMCHMPATGQQGVDLYYRSKYNRNYILYSCAKFSSPTVEFEDTIFKSDDKFDKDIIINLPLYEGLESIEIGVEANSYIKPAKAHKKDGKIVVYGTSITQGGCASRPGMMFSNILSRMMDQEWINLGFSGSGLGETEIAMLINEIEDKKMVILDYEGNGGATGDMDKNLEPFIDTIRSVDKKIPIVVISKVLFTVDLHNTNDLDRREHYFNFQKDMVESKKKNGDKNIYFIAGRDLLGKDFYECLIDGIHLNDMGFYRMAKTLYPMLNKILNK